MLDVLKNNINDILKKENDLSESRLEICKQCPLFKDSSFGPICNSNKYISPDGTNWDIKYHENWVRGCGCKLRSKTRLKNAHCIINKW